MAWTQTDRDNLRQAILDLMLGKRIVSTDVAGKTREFQRGDIEQIKSLLSDMDAELGNVPLRTYAKNGGEASS